MLVTQCDIRTPPCAPSTEAKAWVFTVSDFSKDNCSTLTQTWPQNVLLSRSLYCIIICDSHLVGTHAFSDESLRARYSQVGSTDKPPDRSHISVRWARCSFPTTSYPSEACQDIASVN